MKPMTAFLALLLSCGLAAAGQPGGPVPGGTPPVARDGAPILTAESPWRWYAAWRKPTVPAEALKAAGKDAREPAALPIVKLHGGRGTPDIQHLESPPPAADWTKPEFDDADWPRARGPFDVLNVSTGLLCLRGRFLVSDPAAIGKLRLAMKLRGGAAVYLNGQEVARAHLSAGPAALTAPAEPYPDEAWVDAAGKMLPIPRQAKGDELERIARRDRTLNPVEIPAGALRKGLNVLAVELHRSDYHPAALGWWVPANIVQGITKQWTPVGLLDLSLTASGAGATANLDRVRGMQVWVADIHEQVEDIGYGDPGDETRAIVIRGARNGVFSGQAVVSGEAAIRNLRAEAGELAAAGGARIPASAVQVRGVLRATVGAEQTSGGGGTAWRINALAAPPPGELQAVKGRLVQPFHEREAPWRPLPELPAVATLPLLVTVRVPADAAPGDYQGWLKVSAEGLPETRLPVHLRVAGWTLPPPREFRTRVGLFQSPTTLALQYGVPEWSEEHWKLMEASFQLLGEVGNDIVNVPLSERTQFGNDEGMVRWIRKPDGSYDYDFSVFERYLKLVKKHLGAPRYVALHLWHPGCWQTRKPDEENTVTVVDQKTGKREHFQVPVFGTEESRKFWKPVLDGCRARLAAEGMEKSMCLGILCDATAPPEVFKMFEEIAPGAGWTRGCHSTTFEDKPYGLKGGGVCAYHEFCYGLDIKDPARKFPPIWSQPGPGTAWFRGEWDNVLPLFGYRTMAERGLYCLTAGVGRMGLDFWQAPAEKAGGKTKMACIFNRWPHSSVGGHGDPTITGLADPGPAGARPTLRFELFREGLQEAEALIFIGEAANTRAERLGKSLADECNRVVFERINVCRATQGMTEQFFAGWQERSARLYALAAEVAAKLPPGAK